MTLEICAIFVPFIVLFPLLFAGKTTPFAGSLLGVGLGILLVLLMGAIELPELLIISNQGYGLWIQVASVLLGAFYFVTCSEDSKILAGLMDWISKTLTHRGQRLFLIGFAVSLTFEGAGGFGTPLFLVMPLLLQDGVPALKAAVTPLMAACLGVPFGALGVPVLVGFSGSNAQLVAQDVAPWVALIALPGGILIARNLAQRSLFSRSMLPWLLLVIGAFSGGILIGIRFSASIPTLLGGILALAVGIGTAQKTRVPMSRTAKTGAFIYSGLLTTLLMTRALNLNISPFFVFFLFGSIAVFTQKKILPFQRTFYRSWRTLSVVTAWILWISVVKHLAWIDALGHALPLAMTKALSPWTGFIASVLFGSSTFSNLLLSPITDPRYHAMLAFGAALGTTLTLQSAMVLQSLSPTPLRYSEIARKLVPLFIAGLVIWCLALLLQ